MNQLNVYCGCCHKPVAVVDGSDDMNVLHGTLETCPKCGEACIQGNQVILRDPLMDKVFVMKVEPKPQPLPILPPVSDIASGHPKISNPKPEMEVKKVDGGYASVIKQPAKTTKTSTKKEAKRKSMNPFKRKN